MKPSLIQVWIETRSCDFLEAGDCLCNFFTAGIEPDLEAEAFVIQITNLAEITGKGIDPVVNVSCEFLFILDQNGNDHGFVVQKREKFLLEERVIKAFFVKLIRHEIVGLLWVQIPENLNVFFASVG